MFTLSWSVDDLLDIGVNPLIVIAVLILAILVPIAVVRIVLSKKNYRCTECGEQFKLKPWQIHLGFHDFDGRNSFCPHCQKITYCKYLEDNE